MRFYFACLLVIVTLASLCTLLVLGLSTFPIYGCSQEKKPVASLPSFEVATPIFPLKKVFDKAAVNKEMEKTIPLLMDGAHVPGLSIAIIKDSSVLWHRHFGVKNAEMKAPIKDNTIFEAGSLGKPVFAYAVLKLVEQGKLRLDAPLAQSWIDDDIKNDARAKRITARMVLSHTTGLPNWRQDKPLAICFNPGERFSYSGEGYVYLQRVVERITGERFEPFMEKNVFKPLAMQSSSYVWKEAFDSLAATGHDPSGKATPKRKPYAPLSAATLHTTTLDYAKFLTAIMNGVGLKAETRREMFRPHIKLDPECVLCTDRAPANLSESLAWGLGWGLQHTIEGEAFWHWGDNGNFQGYAVVFKNEKVGLVYFSNSFNGLSVRDELIGHAIGGQHPAFAWAKYDQFNSPQKQFQKLLEKTFIERGSEAGTALYQSFTDKYPVHYVDEILLSNLGFSLLDKKRMNEAVAIFELNAKAYPQSWRVFDSLGLAHMVSGNRKLAIENYKKSLELNPDNARARQNIQMLESLPGQ